ncbi:MAG: iron ABC transporter permease [Candidatus Scalindua sp. AMX11]|nr:MAG: iron ABC transporter permease [Candidatus Scalindua sp.]RZV80510.1 MAG: iron ABC transporter permease [Candidatus Scalindua sp. SCAELEC01]TDE65273.1 MAG: iron ABC transporter permease [Candidatus Scalindua sp. AMX11]
MKNRKIVLFAIPFCWIFIFLLCWKSGTVIITWEQLKNTLFGAAASDQTNIILLQVRLPRLLLAALTGATLSLTGAVFQALLRNPLADPYILGISGGSALGAVVAMGFSLHLMIIGFQIVPIFAVCGAFFTILFVYNFSRIGNYLPTHTMLLAGISLQAMLSALILFLQTLLDPLQLMQVFTWLMGSIPTPEYGNLLWISLYVLLAIGVILPQARHLNALTLGERDAQIVGIDVERLKKILFFSCSLLTGSIVALTGLIGFVGIIIPHLLRLLIGPDHRRLLPACVIAGSIFMVVADTLARVLLAPTEIPVGVITALIGGPFFLFLLWRNKRKGMR